MASDCGDPVDRPFLWSVHSLVVPEVLQLCHDLVCDEELDCLVLSHLLEAVVPWQRSADGPAPYSKTEELGHEDLHSCTMALTS